MVKANKMQQRLASIGVLLAIGFWFGSVEAETVTEDWSNFAPEETPLGIVTTGLPMFAQQLGNARVVETGSTPKNPFEDSQNALYVAPPDELYQFRLRFRPFGDEIVKEGWLEFDFMVLDGDFVMGFGGTTKTYDPSDDWTFIEEERVGAIRFKVAEPMMFAKSALRTPDVSVLEAGRNYRMRLAWKQDADQLTLAFWINGERVLADDYSDLEVSVDAKILAEWFFVFGFYSGSADLPNAEMFLGQIAAGAGDPNP